MIPPASPHFGGLWEAGVKSTKNHLRRVIGNDVLTYEEMNTILIQIEACLNSRPLCPLNTDPNDLSVLTPGHFLIGEPLATIADENWNDVPVNRMSRWQLVQSKSQHFWRRWSSEYLSRLQQRPKWLGESPEVKVGELVLLKDENLPPLKWKLARIKEVFPGSDGHVRVASIITSAGVFKRPIAKLCRLPMHSDMPK